MNKGKVLDTLDDLTEEISYLDVLDGYGKTFELVNQVKRELNQK